MKKNKILVLRGSSHPANMASYLISNLQLKGWDCSVLYCSSEFFYKYFAQLISFNININKWKERFDKKMSSYIKAPSTFIKRTKLFNSKLKKYNEGYDLIFQFSSMFSHYAKEPKTPYVVFIDWTRSLSEREYAGWAPVKSCTIVEKWIELEGNLYRNASRVFTPSNYTRNSLINDYHVDSNKAVAVGYGPTLLDIPSDNYQKRYDRKTILFVGFDFQRKGGFYLLEAFKKVKTVIKDAELIIVTQRRSIGNLTENGITFLDSKTSRIEVIKLFERASIFTMPSLCEPFGLVFLEAMAYRLPCIGTNIDAMPEIIKEGETGYLVPPRDANTLAERILFLLKNPQIIEEMGQAAYTRLKEQFTWDKVASTIDENLASIFKN